MVTCSMGITFSEKTKGERVRFVGDGYFSVHCNKEGEHPKEGEHSFKCDDFEIKWVVEPNGTWLA